MMCGNAKELIAASLAGELGAASESSLRQHLAGCLECAADMAQLGALWEKLGDIPAPEPSHAMTARWEATLAGFDRRPRFTLAALWPARPLWQMAIALACLALGYLIHQPPANRGEIAELRQEVANTKQLVALSLLQQESAGERLRGVDYTEGIRRMEPEVVSALVQAVNGDPSVNVRLAAIDALAKVSGDPGVRQALVNALPRQDSPMVQAALIDYAADYARDRQALAAMKQLTERSDLNPLVKQRADRAVQQLTQYK
jgi:hypothetical protein